MSLYHLLNQNPINVDNWEKIINGVMFFEKLIQEDEKSNWDEIGNLLQKWHRKFDICLEREELNKNEYQLAIAQWKHASRLFICARFAANNPTVVENIIDGNLIEFDNKFKDFLSQLQFPVDDIFQNNNEIPVLCSIFYEKSLPLEVRQIPFATASNEKGGQIHILEIRRVKSYSRAIKNPCVLPKVNNYTNSFGEDFTEAISLALQINVSLWNKELEDLESEIKKLEALPKEELNKSELDGLKRDLRFMQSLGDINRYGILWNVKPYELPTHNFKSAQSPPQIDGKSIGLAAFVGIYFTLRGKFPDERAIYSAALVQNENDDLKITEVNSIPEKIKAVIKINQKVLEENPSAIPPFDGFGIHEKNWNNELLSIIENEQFQIFVLDEDGFIIKTYPEKFETAKHT